MREVTTTMKSIQFHPARISTRHLSTAQYGTRSPRSTMRDPSTARRDSTLHNLGTTHRDSTTHTLEDSTMHFLSTASAIARQHPPARPAPHTRGASSEAARIISAHG